MGCVTQQRSVTVVLTLKAAESYVDGESSGEREGRALYCRSNDLPDSSLPLLRMSVSKWLTSICTAKLN